MYFSSENLSETWREAMNGETPKYKSDAVFSYYEMPPHQ
jgi:hypothetical protein